jgi:AcrR family transcriptional regulator
MKRQAVSPALPRHRHKLSRETVAEAQESRILRATAEAVAEDGYRAVTVADIVRRAGVSTKTFYERFADKDAALLAVYDANDAIIARYAASHSLPAGDPRARLHAAVGFALERLAADETFTRLLVVEAVGSGPRIRARRQETFRGVARLIAATLDEAVDEKIIVAYLGGLTELVLQHVSESPARTIPGLLEVACQFTDAVFFPRARARTRRE